MRLFSLDPCDQYVTFVIAKIIDQAQHITPRFQKCHTFMSVMNLCESFPYVKMLCVYIKDQHNTVETLY